MRNLLIATILGALIGASLTYRLIPAKSVILTKDKIITQTQIQEHVITKTVKEPSGVTTVTRDVIKVVDSKADKVISSLIPVKAVSQYRGMVLFSPTLEFRGAGLERRLFGPVWAGINANKNRDVSVSLSWEF